MTGRSDHLGEKALAGHATIGYESSLAPTKWRSKLRLPAIFPDHGEPALSFGCAFSVSTQRHCRRLRQRSRGKCHGRVHVVHACVSRRATRYHIGSCEDLSVVPSSVDGVRNLPA